MVKKEKTQTKNKTKVQSSSKRSYISQSKIPKLALSEAIRLARSIYDDFAGQPTAPHQLAMAVDISPTSSHWPDLCGASIAYGLTSGGYNAQTISLTDLGLRVVAPTVEGDDLKAKVEAAIRPEIINKFFNKYNRSKFPQDRIARNIIAQMDIPQDRVDTVFQILKRNGEFVGIIHQTKTGPYVAIDQPIKSTESKDLEGQIDIEETKFEGVTQLTQPDQKQDIQKMEKPRVFITHGKNKAIVSQLKELLTFGKFTPVIAEEHETTSKPVPDKVLEDMRSCYAGIIHVESEDKLMDASGEEHHKINENVLIEIGAAMALYKNNFILLVQKGIHLPSNLQGLYKCEYEGKKLEYQATMKLLKAFNEFR